MEETYWNGNGKHQTAHDRLWEELVPINGTAKTKAGELLRASAKVYYRYFNDGDRMQYTLDQWTAESSTASAWKFIYQYADGEFKGKDLAISLLDATSEQDYEIALEKMSDTIIDYVDNAIYQKNDTDYLSDEYKDVFDFEIESEEEDEDFWD